MAATAVIGRDEELGAVEAFLAGIAEGPSALVLSGEPGIGKTVLWETGIDEARENLGRVLTCRGVEPEASLSFAGLSELIAPVLEETADSLPPPRRRALEVALLLREPGDVAPDAHAIGLAVLDVFRSAAAHESILVAVDDAQWLDPASSGALQIALRRLRDEPIGLLATVRVAPEVTASFELGETFPAVERLRLAPLSAGAVHRLLKERLGLELTRPELTRVHEATAGNPFFALELGRELVRTGARPAPGQVLPVPESLRDLLGDRLARLPGETLDVLLEVAALARPTVDVVAAAHGGRDRVHRALETAAREGVVELDGERIRFAHPLLASISYDEAPVWKRRAVHRALAGAVTDVEERARHLALAAEGPDAAIASELDTAAEYAAARGATGPAAELSGLAAELTPDDPVSARQRRLRAANCHRLAGETEQAIALLEQLLTEVPSGVERADVLLELATTLAGDAPTIIARCSEALAEVPGDDARAARILVLRSLVKLIAADVSEALVDARAALDKAERVGDPELLCTAIARLGHAETWGAEVTPGLLERGAELEARLGLSLEYLSSPSGFLARRVMRTGELDRARALLEDVDAKAVARGDEYTRVLVRWYMSQLEWYEGRWERSLEFASAAHELGELAQFSHDREWVGRIRGLIEADVGLVEEARASAEQGLAFAQARSDETFRIACEGVLGRVDLALGDPKAAARRLRGLPARLHAGGFNDPMNPVWEDAIEALVAVGELEQARAYLEPFETSARRLGSPWAEATACRCRGLLAAAEGDPDAACIALDRALAHLEARPFPLERGRILLSLGVVRRQAQQRKAAREALEQALAVFDELGARLWAERACAELHRVSGRKPPGQELTPTEEQVGALAARGRTNKEIAAELYMGVSTVEAHLTHIYRKLEIRSRTELAGRITARDHAPDASNETAQVESRQRTQPPAPTR